MNLATDLGEATAVMAASPSQSKAGPLAEETDAVSLHASV